jgi:hypothetical protein
MGQNMDDDRYFLNVDPADTPLTARGTKSFAPLRRGLP